MKILLFFKSYKWVWFICAEIWSLIFNFNGFFLFFLQVDTYGAVYKKLTGKEVTFEFPEPYL